MTSSLFKDQIFEILQKEIFKQNHLVMKKLIWILLPLLFLFTNCQKDENVPNEAVEYVVFGQFYGECAGEACIEIFKIEDGQLFEDTKDNYPSFVNPYEGEYILLDDSLYQLVNDLETKVPDELYSETETVIGQPDAGDWGGYYFEIVIDGIQYHYRIDKATNNLPDYLKDFASDLETYLAEVVG